MINSVQLKNFGPLVELDWQNLGQINLVIGNNGCGKSFLLKTLYTAVRTLEDYKRGDNPESIESILTSKLYWTFQSEKIGDLVTRRSDSSLSFSLMFNQKNFSYSFDKESWIILSTQKNEVPPRTDNSIYLPSKEILSILHIILDSRDLRKQFGFDDTYLDLAKALSRHNSDEIAFQKFFQAASKLDSESIKNINGVELYKQFEKIKSANAPHPISVFDECQQRLNDMLGGKIEYDIETNKWHFKQGDQLFPVGVMAEGIKKIAILDTLLGNGYLNENSIIFIDEPESALHPKAISDLLDIITILAKNGIQFFMASHSYFVIKKLFLIAQEQKLSIPVLSQEDDGWQQSDLLDEMPNNAIIDESIRLYKEEINLPA